MTRADKAPVQLSVIFTTYNSPRWLEKVLWGFAAQDYRDFEVLVADDGSGPETRALVERISAEGRLNLRHVWHEDQGFRKCAILNKAIVAAQGDYLVFTDGDCIPRADFLAVHAAQAERGRFLSGGYYKLPMATSEAIAREDVESGRAFDKAWLRQHGMPASLKTLKLTAQGRRARLLNAVTTTNPTFNGHNASAWREDVMAANGFDERLNWGGLDREFGERLENAGIRGKQIRYSAICLHLDHARGYKKPELVAYNRCVRDLVARHAVQRTPFGIEHFADPHAQDFADMLARAGLDAGHAAG